MNAFVADHGDGGGEQAGEREQQQPPFERKGDVGDIQATNNGEQDDDFRPRFGRPARSANFVWMAITVS